MPLNVKLFNKVLDHIREEKKRLYMGVYGVQKGSLAADGEEIKNFPACNTKACFAGWACLLTTPKKEWSSWFSDMGYMDSQRASKTARERLGLTPFEADCIFMAIYGDTPAQEFKTVKNAIKIVIQNRVESGETEAKKIRV